MLAFSGAAAATVVTALTSTLLIAPRPALVWNASVSSVPGLYGVTPPGRVRAGDIVIAWPPPPARRLAAARFYLPSTVPLVKPVAAVAGDRVCAMRERIFVNGRAAAVRRARDPSGRPMPWWSGCRLLGPGELFLLSAHVGEAFDGRYFGVTRASEVLGKARLLWAR
jgi:conjugative transfer signal peptidase TraF